MSEKKPTDPTTPGNERRTNSVDEEAIRAGLVTVSASGDAGGPPASPRSEAAELEQSWRIAAVIALLLAVGAAAADHLHPPIAATFETLEPNPGTVVALRDASLTRRLAVTTSAFGLSQIPPLGPIEVPGRGGKLLVRLRVSAVDCERLAAELGGTCAGRSEPVPMPEQLGIAAREGRLEMRLEMTPAAQARLGQRPLTPRPRREWSLIQNARETTLTLRCLRPIQLSVTLPPRGATPRCSPDGRFFELALVNRKPYAPTLAFDDSRSFRALAMASSVELAADTGTLSFGDVEREIQGVAPAPVRLEGEESVQMRLLAPGAGGAATTRLISPRTAKATIGNEDALPSLLERNSDLETIVYGLLATSLLAALTFYVRALVAYREEER